MTNITQLTERKLTLRSRIITMLAVGFVLMALQASPAQAQWTIPDANNNINNTNTGNVGIGTTNPVTQLHVANQTAAVPRGITNSQHTADGNAALFTFRKSRGTLTSPAATVNGDFIGNLYGEAYDGASYISGGRIRFGVDGTVSAGNVPTSLQFLTGSNGSGTERMRITSAGNVGIGTATPTRALEVLAADGNAMRAYRNGSTVNWGVNLTFALNNSSGSQIDYAGVHGQVAANTAGAEGGNLALSTMTNGSLSEKMRITPAGYVGIGTTSPLYSLDVNGGANGFRAKAATVSSSDAIATFENSSGIQGIFRGNGYLGLGTTSPGYKLDVQGGAINASGGLCIAGDCKSAWSQVGGGGSSQWTTGSSNDIYYNLGNVGIGNTSPQSNLQIGAQTGSASASPLRLSLGGTYSNAAGTNFKLRLYDDGVVGNVYGLGVSAGSMDFGVSPSAGYNWYSGGAHKMALTSSGNFGIGTTSPTAALDVQVPLTAVTAYGVRFQQSLTAGNNNAELNGLFINPNFIDGVAVGVRHNALVTGAGNVGIGTSATSAGLDVQNVGIAASGTTFGTRFQQVIPSAGNYATSTAVYINPNFSDGQAVGVRHNGLVVASGDVGIGTSTPATRLHVVGDGTITGNLNVTGNIAAKYQDVAEWVESSQALSAGTVVVLDHTKSNQVVASSQAYDTRVAGVISSQPGIALGVEGAGKVLVATTGRVRIKVDASRGSIQVGDLLVTSGVAGLAMKSEPIDVGGVQIHRPGTLIGKALEPLATGTAEILVLLSLQ